MILLLILIIIGTGLAFFIAKKANKIRGNNEHDPSIQNTKTNHASFGNVIKLLLGMLVIGVLIATLGFHYVFKGYDLVVFPKKSIGFTYTYINVDEFVDQVNSTPLLQRDDNMKYLVNELKKRGVIWEEK